ncbi:hypothetical protein ACFLQ8_02335 [Candidatus Auribacterota bacterium]
MSKENKNCWDYWGCQDYEKEDCIVYKNNAGRRCYTFMTGFKPEKMRDFLFCIDCPWYKELIPE